MRYLSSYAYQWGQDEVVSVGISRGCRPNLIIWLFPLASRAIAPMRLGDQDQTLSTDFSLRPMRDRDKGHNLIRVLKVDLRTTHFIKLSR